MHESTVKLVNVAAKGCRDEQEAKLGKVEAKRKQLREEYEEKKGRAVEIAEARMHRTGQRAIAEACSSRRCYNEACKHCDVGASQCRRPVNMHPPKCNAQGLGTRSSTGRCGVLCRIPKQTSYDNQLVHSCSKMLRHQWRQQGAGRRAGASKGAIRRRAKRRGRRDGRVDGRERKGDVQGEQQRTGAWKEGNEEEDGGVRKVCPEGQTGSIKKNRTCYAKKEKVKHAMFAARLHGSCTRLSLCLVGALLVHICLCSSLFLGASGCLHVRS